MFFRTAISHLLNLKHIYRIELITAVGWNQTKKHNSGHHIAGLSEHGALHKRKRQLCPTITCSPWMICFFLHIPLLRQNHCFTWSHQFWWFNSRSIKNIRKHFHLLKLLVSKAAHTRANPAQKRWYNKTLLPVVTVFVPVETHIFALVITRASLPVSVSRGYRY